MTLVANPKFSNIARPYALAAFDYARDQQQLPPWKIFLEAAATAAEQSDLAKLLANPQISAEKLLVLFCDVLASLLDTERKNFLKLLAQNNRLLLLPEIAWLFNDYYAALEKISTVRVITAMEAQEEFKKELAAALTKRIQHEVTLQCEVDPSLLGGAVVHIGDKVIDGSIRGKLTRLLEFSLR